MYQHICELGLPLQERHSSTVQKLEIAKPIPENPNPGLEVKPKTKVLAQTPGLGLKKEKWVISSRQMIKQKWV